MSILITPQLTEEHNEELREIREGYEIKLKDMEKVQFVLLVLLIMLPNDFAIIRPLRWIGHEAVLPNEPIFCFHFLGHKKQNVRNVFCLVMLERRQ